VHIWLRNGFPVALLFGPWLGPTCRLSAAVATELSVAAAYLAVSITLLKAAVYLRGRWARQVWTAVNLKSAGSLRLSPGALISRT
jgi:hypothetical protein